MATKFVKNGERIVVDGGLYRDDVACHVSGLTYDFINQRGILHMPSHNCTDMTGCIALFTAIDPSAKIIKAVAGRGGSTFDSLYRKGDNGKWEALFIRAGEAVDV